MPTYKSALQTTFYAFFSLTDRLHSQYADHPRFDQAVPRSEHGC